MPSTAEYEEQVDLLRRGSDALRIAYTSSSAFLTSPTCKVQSLIVFDSSFNPPTIAHLELINRTIANPAFVPRSATAEANVLLLLAVQNADKPTAPAPLADRLSMMQQFSLEIGRAADCRISKVNIAVGITKYPRFVDKAEAVFHMFPGVEEQVYLTGYDTLIRLLDAKYYPCQTLQYALGDFMTRCKIVCYVRDNPKWGTAAEQVQFVQDIKAGRRTDIPRLWADRIWLLSYADPICHPGDVTNELHKLDLAIVSSTAARDASKHGKVRFMIAEVCRACDRFFADVLRMSNNMLT
ncbi:uncharacterized protein V1513DRAFT_374790 [Lipomyces chichibuensis]|uniref:uncharacterized protein n=1 Tax=Lipomyces chichibuensis TaxID=1546026 RepID=UPI003343E2A6